MTEILAATRIDVTADRLGERAELDFGPLDWGGGSKVAPTTSFRVRVDRLLLPDQTIRAAYCLQPILRNVVDASGCGAGVFTEPSYDPVKREVVLRQSTGYLVPGTRYQLTLYSAGNDAVTGFRAYDGVPLAAPVQVEFDVLPFPRGLPLPYDLPSTADHFCERPDPHCDVVNDTHCVRSASQMLAACATGGCHGAGVNEDAGTPGMPSEDLRLGSIEGLLGTAIDHVAHETETGEAAAQPVLSSLRFGRSMPVISSGASGYSYLLYKLLANPDNPLEVRMDPGEIGRLTSSVVVGMPMPPSTLSDDLRPRAGEIEWLSEWVLQGAPAHSCP